MWVRWLKPWVVGVLLTVIIVMFPSKVFAKLVTAGPDRAIEGASIVVTATVLEREYTKVSTVASFPFKEEQRKVVLQIDAVLKGQVDRDRLEWQFSQPRMYGWLGFDFPAPGTQVLLLLQGDYYLAWDLNCVALVEDGHVTSLYNGATIGSDEQKWEPADYANAYDIFYQAHIEGSTKVTPTTLTASIGVDKPVLAKAFWARLWESSRDGSERAKEWFSDVS